MRFLRHIERTRTLAYLIPVDALDVQEEYELLRSELRKYSDELADKPHVVLITKMDILGPDDEPPRVDAPDAWGQFAISAVAHQGLTDVLEAMWQRVRDVVADEKPDEEETYRP